MAGRAAGGHICVILPVRHLGGLQPEAVLNLKG